MKIVKGNLLDKAEAGEFDVIAHGCNCFNSMSGGLALEISRRYPTAVDSDNNTLPGDAGKLGNVSVARWNLSDTRSFMIFNIYSQYHGGANIDYKALKEGLQRLNKECKGLRVGLPQIGCGIAGGDWDIVSQMIENIMVDCDVTIVMFEKEKGMQISIEQEYQKYLSRMELRESDMGDVQRSETKRAFIGGFGQSLITMMQLIAEEDDDDVDTVKIVDDAFRQITEYFDNEVKLDDDAINRGDAV